MTDYSTFLTSKRFVAPSTGIDIAPEQLHPGLFGFQRDLVRWGLRKGRAALFADTGLGKTIMQLAWAQHAADRVLILAPLAVAQQTVREGARWGLPVTYARRPAQSPATGITITNYELLEHFAPAEYGAVVLDESSILKAFRGQTKQALIAACRSVPMRLCCTATPAPNDTVELCNHADFLGIMAPGDMITQFFISKGQDEKAHRFRLKNHARQAFWRWLASWSMSLKHPSDLGYADEGFALPPLTIHPVIVGSGWAPDDQLFFTELKGVTHRAAARKATIAARVDATVARIEAEPAEQWLVWCGLNDEGRQVGRAIPGAVVLEGPDSPEHKADVLTAFAAGELRVLVTKPSIAGFGLNFQGCARMAFVGLGDSYEQYYQAIRRCWRFGQHRPVDAYIVLADVEEAVYNNVLRKEQEAAEIGRELLQHVAEFERAEIAAVAPLRDAYEPTQPLRLPSWLRSQATTGEELTPCR